MVRRPRVALADRLLARAALVACAALAFAPGPGAHADGPPSVDDLLARFAAAPAERAEIAGALLRRDDDRARAWGAFVAAEEGLAAVGPDLVRLLRRRVASPDAVGLPAMLAVFDALVRLGVPVPGDDLIPFVAGERRHHLFAPPATILAVRSDDPATWLTVFDALDRPGADGGGDDRGGDDEPWLALGNALAARRTPGFAARLLPPVRFRVTIVVKDTPAFRAFGSSTTVSIRAGDGRFEVPDGFPPLFAYDLTEREGEGTTLLADGPRTIRFTRKQSRGGFGSTRGPPDRDRDRLEWVATLLGTPLDRLPLEASASQVVWWSNADRYRTAAVAAVRRVLDRYWETAARLVAAEALTLEEAHRLRPRLDVEVSDEREVDRADLPGLPDPDLTCPLPPPTR